MEGYKYVRSNNNQMVPQINRKAALSELGTKPSSSLEAVDQVSSPRAEASAPGLPDEGVIPRAIRELFAQVERKRSETKGKTKISVKV